ncbi:hypothetical protein BJI67_11930 [Acidihalobacter aeolianus]|uniref:Metalloprotease TldD/E C-terminal domain-containing protein n=1 Tax=Acidihalobacter aeolianus TaxID=2792603 RepID=A0A1D8K9N8_9GAMM|nr:metallopeptidase TldD-related protein [Acidihalobacter aeolianus]AOV17674.1 hypothetical protein BJI67_11930 [Acidihalobacter aeolianus]
MNDLQPLIHTLAERLPALASDGETLFAYVYGEQTDFARLSRSRINQLGHIHQRRLTLTLSDGRSAVKDTWDFDAGALDTLAPRIERLRGDLAASPDDPYLSLDASPRTAHSGQPYEERDLEPWLEALLANTADDDLVGIALSGPQGFGLASSLGHALSHRSGGLSLDASLFTPTHQAVKIEWSAPADGPADPAAALAQARERLALLGGEPYAPAPGRYRAYLAPEALTELLGVTVWQGFSRQAVESGNSPLDRLFRGTAGFAPNVRLRELREDSNAPPFGAAGHTLPGAVDLVIDGRAGDTLVSPRAALEYGGTINSDSGMPIALTLDGGDLAEADALAALGTGLYLGRLWYANLSDPTHCRVTAMTRYDCFWVEDGRIRAPLAPMRIDASLYSLLGPDLIALSRERHRLEDTSSYERRASGHQLLPGALCAALPVTL